MLVLTWPSLFRYMLSFAVFWLVIYMMISSSVKKKGPGWCGRVAIGIDGRYGAQVLLIGAD